MRKLLKVRLGTSTKNLREILSVLVFLLICSPVMAGDIVTIRDLNEYEGLGIAFKIEAQKELSNIFVSLHIGIQEDTQPDQITCKIYRGDPPILTSSYTVTGYQPLSLYVDTLEHRNDITIALLCPHPRTTNAFVEVTADQGKTSKSYMPDFKNKISWLDLSRCEFVR